MKMRIASGSIGGRKERCPKTAVQGTDYEQIIEGLVRLKLTPRRFDRKPKLLISASARLTHSMLAGLGQWH
jgi:hypothetical protein